MSNVILYQQKRELLLLRREVAFSSAKRLGRACNALRFEHSQRFVFSFRLEELRGVAGERYPSQLPSRAPGGDANGPGRAVCQSPMKGLRSTTSYQLGIQLSRHVLHERHQTQGDVRHGRPAFESEDFLIP